MKWVRPGGIVGIAAVAAVLGLFWWLLADWLVKTSIEQVGTRVVGARVEVGDVDLTFSPFGFRLDQLYVADPERPMENLVQCASVIGQLQFWKLLMGQVIVEDLAASGVKFSTPRTTSGEIEKIAKPGETGEDKGGFDFAGLQGKLPSVDDILAREPLTTTQKATDLKELSQARRVAIEQGVDALPDESRIDEYEARIKDLTSGKIDSLESLKKRTDELTELKNAIRKDKHAVEQLRDAVREAKATLSEAFSELKEAPGRDLARIKERYGLDQVGAANVARLLFGDTAKVWLEKLQTWYDSIKGFLPRGDEEPEPVKPKRGEGRFIHFATDKPLPDFLVQRAHLDMELPVGDVGATLTDITHQPHILGRPLTLQATGEKLAKAQSLRIEGVFDHVDPNQSQDRMDWSLEGWQISDAALSQSESLTLVMERALVDLSGSMGVMGSRLSGNVDGGFKSVDWSSPTKEGWTGQLVKTLATVNEFNVAGKLGGDILSPDMTISSNLDEIIKRVAISELSAQQKELEKKLRTHLDAEVEKVAGPYQDQVAALTKSEGNLDERIAQLEELLKAELKSAVDSQKKEVEEKLKDKLKGLGF